MVELSDEHGITGDQEVEVTRIRIKFSKRDKVSVRCQSNDVGELKVPVVEKDWSGGQRGGRGRRRRWTWICRGVYGAEHRGGGAG